MTTKNKKVGSAAKPGSSNNAEMNFILQSTKHLKPTKKQQIYALADFQKHLKIMTENSPDLLFDNRFDSFTQNDWPFSEPEGDLCNPRELALAGLTYLKTNSTLCARCVVCGCVITNLKGNSNPWKLHAGMKPDCTIIKMGKPKNPDSYTMVQLADIFYANHIGILERGFEEIRNNVTRDLFKLNELYDKKQNDDSF